MVTNAVVVSRLIERREPVYTYIHTHTHAHTVAEEIRRDVNALSTIPSSPCFMLVLVLALFVGSVFAPIAVSRHSGHTGTWVHAWVNGGVA